ncbi:GNAT family N-acetyltransferase [Frankia sp. Mgl5]|uniref:GNAT family N-acetyltransferase n=1 Tax=Frankia sp. Mgl5 TaxID=2933793 RepID=UPI00200E8AAA|nr:GNAT family N-acetyltransferase [Frankia sp. Mgl5]MCK9930956.1 GNAT family N-acetyltransferase [Frankia sp. Mgl5]
MTTSGLPRVRVAQAADAEQIARLLRAFNAEYDEPAPEQGWLADRVALLLGQGATAVLLLEASADRDDADGLALTRFRPSLWDDADECYLAELYVRPALRGRGLGRILLTATMEHASRRGATYMDLTTTNADTAAVALYESVGFDRHERRGPGTDSYYFEIDLPGPDS